MTARERKTGAIFTDTITHDYGRFKIGPIPKGDYEVTGFYEDYYLTKGEYHHFTARKAPMVRVTASPGSQIKLTNLISSKSVIKTT